MMSFEVNIWLSFKNPNVNKELRKFVLYTLYA